MASDTSSEATQALQKLIANDDLKAWNNKLRHSLAQQRQRTADETLLPLTCDQVFNVIRNETPTTARDFHALVVDQILSIAKELRDGKTDGYKIYWNTKEAHNQTTTPKVEENSRDRLVEALKQKLSSFPDIHVEPEGRYADAKRADIKVLYKNWNIPIEIKQDYHKDLWGAAENQLIALYIRDQGTDGYGIYLVFWYGVRKNGLQPPPPERNIPIPKTAQDLEKLLQEMVPDACRATVRVIVLDVSTRKAAKQSL